MRDDRVVDYTKRAWGALIMFIFSFLSYSPLVLSVDEYANNATLTNAVWVLMDTVFPLFWTLFTILWLVVALYNILKVMRFL